VTGDEFRRELLHEQYGHTTPEQATRDRRDEHPEDDDLTKAARRRVLHDLDPGHREGAVA
jgi:hypothetical protein